MSVYRARFVAAFLKRAFRGRAAISIFCHEDKLFPDIRAGGKVDDISVYGSRYDWKVKFGLNRCVWFVDGHVDIKLERNTPILRVSSSAPSGAKIQLAFMPEVGYGPLDDSVPAGDSRDDYDLWANARRVLEHAPMHDRPHQATDGSHGPQGQAGGRQGRREYLG